MAGYSRHDAGARDSFGDWDGALAARADQAMPLISFILCIPTPNAGGGADCWITYLRSEPPTYNRSGKHLEGRETREEVFAHRLLYSINNLEHGSLNVDRHDPRSGRQDMASVDGHGDRPPTVPQSRVHHAVSDGIEDFSEDGAEY